jgi:DnaJ-class molecular chaperone
MDNPYTILGVAASASKEEITKEYRKQARLYHPDKNKESGAGDKFARLKDAYDYLMDDQKRAFFDQTGTRMDESRAASSGMSRGFPAGFPFPGFPGFPGGQPSPEQMRELKQRQLNMHMNISLSLEQIYSGFSRNVHYQRVRIVDQVQTKEDCTVWLTIPPGIHTQSKIEIKSHGHVMVEKGVEWMGSLIVVITQTPHSMYERDLHHPEHLKCVQEISLAQALCGMTLEISHPSGKSVVFEYHDTIQPLLVYRIPNKGLPVMSMPNTCGDLMVRFVILYPTMLTPSQKDGLANLFQYTLPARSDTDPICTLIPYTPSPEESSEHEPSEQVQCAQS